MERGTEGISSANFGILSVHLVFSQHFWYLFRFLGMPLDNFRKKAVLRKIVSSGNLSSREIQGKKNISDT